MLMMWWIVALVALVLGLQSRKRLAEMLALEEERTRALERLAARIAALETMLAQRAGAPSEAPAATPAAMATQPAAAPPERMPVVEPRPMTPIATPPLPPPPVVPPMPRPTPPPIATERPRPAAATPPPPPPPPRPPSPRFPTPSIDWEGLVGVKLFSWIAGIALVMAAVFFLRYSIEHGWLTKPIQMAIGLAVGTGLLVGCELRAARRYPVTANALDAAGIAVLFATLFASHALWNLVPQVPTLCLMTLVTAVAVLLSIRRDSVFIALLGLVGGFATPALLSTGEDRPIGLFGYLLLLNVGLAWVAHRKQWAVLTVLSVVFTALYQWGWVLEFLDASRLPLALSIFVVFPLVQGVALLLGEREAAPRAPLFARTAIVAAAVPLLFGLYLAAVPQYGSQTGLLFGFMLLLALGLTAIAAARGPGLLHPLGGLATILAFAVWFAVSYSSTSWPGVLGWVAVFVLAYLAAPALCARLGRPLGIEGRWGARVAPTMLFVFPALAVLEPATAEPGVLFVTLLALLAAIATVAVRRGDGSLHYLAAFFALAAEAVWSARYLTPERLLPALLLYGGFGLFYVGVPVVAARLGKRLEPEPGGAVVLLVSLGLLFFLATGAVAQTALWGLGLLLVVLNAGMFVQASVQRWPLVSLVGGMVSWLVLAVWWGTAMVAALLLPSLVVVAGFALLVLAGNAWLATRADTKTEELPLAVGLALVAHLFLAVVAVQPALALPPWPLFAVLAVLDLAVAVAALAIRDGRPHLAAVVLSQLLVALWVATARTMPWTLVALGAAAAVVLLGIVWIPFARRRGVAPTSFAQAAVGAIVLAQVIAILAGELGAAPPLGWLVADHVLLLVALLAVAEEMGWPVLSIVGAVPAAIATTFWADRHLAAGDWIGSLVFAAVPFVVLIGYPLMARAETRTSRHPYVATVVAGVPFLWLARRCLIAGGWESIVGIVPVVQAALMLVLLRRLVAARRGPIHEDGRIALVAGTVLGFVTVAVPIQLSREWITVAWAIEAAALAWLYGRVRFPQLVRWTLGIGAAVFVRLALNPAVLEYHPRADTPIWNWYLYTYGVSAGALFVAARLLRGTDDRILPGWPRVSTVLPAAAAVLLFLLLNIEIADFYSAGRSLTFNFSAGLAQDLTYTIGWALFAIGLLVAGIRGKSRPIRSAALGLLVVTVVKCFLHDLWRLGGLYRVGSFVGLAVCLSLVAILLQRFVFVPREETS